MDAQLRKRLVGFLARVPNFSDRVWRDAWLGTIGDLYAIDQIERHQSPALDFFTIIDTVGSLTLSKAAPFGPPENTSIHLLTVLLGRLPAVVSMEQLALKSELVNLCAEVDAALQTANLDQLNIHAGDPHVSPRLRNLLSDVGATGVRTQIVNLCGPRRLGRTTLLREFGDYITSLSPGSTVGLAAPGQAQHSDPEILLLQTLVKQLEAAVFRNAPLPLDYQPFGHPRALKGLLFRILNYCRKSSCPVLLAIDDYHRLDQACQIWFEDDILKPIVDAQIPGLFVVLSSLKELTFVDHSIARRRRVHKLTPLSRADIDREYPVFGDISHHILELSHGLPALVARLVRVLQDCEAYDEPTWQLCRPEVRARFYGSGFLGDVLDASLDGYHRVLVVLALARRFDVGLIEDLSRFVSADVALDPALTDGVSVLRSLRFWVEGAERPAHWISTERDLGLWKIGAVYEGVLRDYLEYSDPKLCRRVHQRILTYYWKRLRHGYVPSYAVEAIYHRSRISRVGRRARLTVNREEAQELYSALAADPALSDVFTECRPTDIVTAFADHTLLSWFSVV